MKCTVLTSSKSAGISDGLSYEAGSHDLQIGAHVHVPLRGKTVEGIVTRLTEELDDTTYALKPVHSLAQEKPLLTKAHIQTLEWMSNYYYCSPRQALRVFLPSAPWDDLRPQDIVGYKKVAGNHPVRGDKQIAILDLLEQSEWTALEHIREHTGAQLTSIRSLEEKGYIEKVIQREEIEVTKPTIKPPQLTESQQKVFQEMLSTDNPSLLFGITGSGKTEVYAALIEKAVLEGKQAILLVPEILLTEHSIYRFDQLLGHEHIAVLHSKLTPAAKRREWKRIHTGQVSLVIGSRSALFAPLHNLGVVIIDEEHEWTYKNEQTPRYHARETAEALCKFAKAKLVLGSATPSLESWQKMKHGQYSLSVLEERYMGNTLPEVRVIDLVQTEFSDHYPFSPSLLNAIEDRLHAKEQSVLFLNRRGNASALFCQECRRRIVSAETQLPFTVHKDYEGRMILKDHSNGSSFPAPARCPSCDSAKLIAIGAGTQRIEEIIAAKFPQARVIRADSDTITHPEDMKKLLEDMREQKADILLGTQSVVKGLDLPEVTLAAVLVADVGLSLPHFRAGERIYQLLTQLTGRSGRAKPGEVIIQTFRPDAPEVKFAASHQTKEYIETELKLRELSSYPPFTQMVRFIFRGLSAEAEAQNFKAMLAEIVQSRTEIYSVQSSQTLFGGGKVWHVILKGNNIDAVMSQVDTRNVIVDRDPIDTL